MGNKKISGKLRYKDKGHVTYNIIEEKNTDLRDCLEVIYEDDQKRYDWHYYWQEDGKTAIDHLLEITYENMKAGFVNREKKGRDFVFQIMNMGNPDITQDLMENEENWYLTKGDSDTD